MHIFVWSKPQKSTNTKRHIRLGANFLSLLAFSFLLFFCHFPCLLSEHSQISRRSCLYSRPYLSHSVCQRFLKDSFCLFTFCVCACACLACLTCYAAANVARPDLLCYEVLCMTHTNSSLLVRGLFLLFCLYSISLSLSHTLFRVYSHTIVMWQKLRAVVVVAAFLCTVVLGPDWVHIYIAPKIKVYQLHNQENQAHLTIPLTQTHTHI